MASKRADIQQALVDRLKTITTANGYTTNVANVYADEIPLGLDLEDHQLPAILVISGKDTIKIEHQCVKGNWLIELQCIHRSTEGDSVMNTFISDIARAIHANSPTAQRNDAWRAFNGKPYNMEPVTIETDLNMIDANRFILITYLVQYSTHLWDL